MQFLLILLLCVGSAIGYGIAYDQITARVCVEYFTIGHPPVFDTESPTLLALGWGVIATWWVGVMLGVPLAIAARAGGRPKRTAASLVRPVAILLVVMAFCALLAGGVGFLLARQSSCLSRWRRRCRPTDMSPSSPTCGPTRRAISSASWAGSCWSR